MARWGNAVAAVLALALLAGCGTPAEPTSTSAKTDQVTPSTVPAVTSTLSESPTVPIAEVPPAAVNLAFSTPLLVSQACGSCWEPTVAVAGDGAVAVTRFYPTPALYVALPGSAEFVERALPPIGTPGLGSVAYGDPTIQAGPDGRLYYTSLVLTGVDGLVTEVVGIQVAATADAGTSWDTNVIVGFANGADIQATGGDRQWLGFGPDGKTMVDFTSYAPNPAFITSAGLWTAVSNDGARSFSSLVQADGTPPRSGLAGPPLLAGQRWLIPFLDLGTPGPGESGLGLATSEDDGKSWQWADMGSEGAAQAIHVPVIASGPEGLVLSWMGSDGSLRTAVSRQEPLQWSATLSYAPGTLTMSPWLIPQKDGTLAVWKERDGEGSYRVVAGLIRGTPADPGGPSLGDVQVIASKVGAAENGADGDFTHAAAVPGGGAVVVWSDIKAGKTFVAFRTP